MCQTIDEYAEKYAKNYAKAYGQECEARGRQEDRNDMLMQMIANGDLTAAQAAKYQTAY